MRNSQIQKSFIVGDQWLYYKIYCGVKTADMVLTEIIKPLTEKLITEKLIDQWFFIRYTEPEPHIRVRFHLSNIIHIGNLLVRIKDILKPYIDNYQIWDLQLATYQREIERYGINTIDLAEKLFHHDSEHVLKIIENSENDEARFLKLFKWLEHLLNLFNFEDKNLLSFLEERQNQFKQEFEADKNVRKKLSRKYRNLEHLLLSNNDLKTQYKDYCYEIVERLLILEKEKNLHVSINSLLASFIHMSINRCFRSEQRLYEMMLYDFLYRKNNSKYIRYGSL